MGKWIALVGLILLSAALPNAYAGDEDTKEDKKVVAPKEPEPIEAPAEAEAPDMSLPEEDAVVSPDFAEEASDAPAPPPSKKRGAWDPDRNLNYSELLSLAETGSIERGVLPPALGARGYRPNLVGIGVGDRTPGYGAMLEYSWNRLGAGVFFSHRILKDVDRRSLSQSIGGFYLLYRWLPWSFSPYFLAGLELGSQTPDTFGGNVGLGMEIRVYSGWTALLGYTYHSTARKGFMGGALAWTF